MKPPECGATIRSRDILKRTLQEALMNKIRCLLSGGCRFRDEDTKVYIDKNNIFYMIKGCCKCGKKKIYAVPFEDLLDVLKGK